MESKILYGYTIFKDGTVLGKRGGKLSWYENGRGYLISRLFWEGKWKTKSLHTVICEAFHGPRPEGYEAAHKDGNSKNNHKDNLKWMTKTNNRLQMYQDGRDVSGNKNANSKLSIGEVKQICEEFVNHPNKSSAQIARELDVSKNSVRFIRARKQWKNISCNFNF